MKLLEFFSTPNNPKDEEESSEQVQKDLMAFILDDDDIYKEHILPLINQLKSKLGKGEDLKSLESKYLEVVNDCCTRFYKDQDLKTDPNKIFPVKMRKKVATQLMSINKNSLKKKKKQDEH